MSRVPFGTDEQGDPMEPLPLELSKIQKTFDLEMFWCILIGHAETGDSVGNARRGRAHGSLR
jgi:hypothetical protein